MQLFSVLQKEEIPLDNKALSLRHNFAWTLAGNVVYSGCQWLMLIVIARLGTPEMVGRFALAYAITAPIIMFANLQLKAVQATDAKLDFQFNDYLALRLTTTSLAVIAIVLIAFIPHNEPNVALVVIAIGLAKAVESLSDIHYGFFQLHGRMDRIAISSIFKGPLAIIALTAGLYFSRDIFWGSIAMAAALAAVYILYDIPNAQAMLGRIGHQFNATENMRLRPRWHKPTLIELTWLSLPLGFTMLFISLNANLPRYFIAEHLGERDLGIFASMTYMLMATSMIVAALADATSPKLAKHYADKNVKAFCLLLVQLLCIGAAGAVGLVAVIAWKGQWVLGQFYGPEYASHPAVFIWVAVATGIGFVQWFLGNAMTAARCFRVQVVLLASNTVITIIACSGLIPRYGMMGAAYTLIISNVSLAIGTLLILTFAIKRIRYTPESFKERQSELA